MALLEDADPGAEVMLAHQPNYPLAFQLAGVTLSEDLEAEEGEEESAPVVWLLQGDHAEDPYGVPGGVWEAGRTE